MKKSLLALAVLGAFAGAASAQSSVTLYGLIDVGLTSDKSNSGDSTKNMRSGLLNGSRWGLRGREDLGGGLAADFQLESGFNIDNGSFGDSSRLFNRTATVGLSGGFGTVNLGRSLTLYDDVRGSFVMERTDFDPSVNVQKEGGYDYVGRFDNRIRYLTPAMGGFFAGFEVSGEKGAAPTTTPLTPTSPAITTASAAGGNRSFAGKLGYAAGPVNVQFGFQRDNVADFDLSTTALEGPHDALDHMTLLGSYNLGVATLSAMFTRESNKVTPEDDNANEWALGAKFPLGANAQIAAAYARSKVSGADNAATGFGLEGQYKLSARTKLYAGYRTNKDDDAARSKDTTFGVGLQHRF